MASYRPQAARLAKLLECRERICLATRVEFERSLCRLGYGGKALLVGRNGPWALGQVIATISRCCRRFVSYDAPADESLGAEPLAR
jgi:hypothetical protein